MLACYFTKPLQGTMFHVFRNIIMGHARAETIRNITYVLIKELVLSVKPENENNARVQTNPPANIEPDPRNQSEPTVRNI